ncbi:uncharacterized protein LOC110106739 [Dendrobium catenatum]|uniref:ZCF37 n=1 Tax=Dendrobium catenatum TaxID=906689 RepID=A0A2I0WZL1_9ASPA|nr:uncharacterized protein LOC110106739 [Dendrobium catenatum]PKU81098.1 hypothetical protein MA16_Dca026601 [Dendrobium catenatum]
MLRGVSSFNHVDDDLPNSTPSTPKSSKKKQQSSNSKNPYSSRGLEKFTSVLSDLEARKEKIMAKKGLNGNSGTMVRFMYSNSQDWIPIVVRVREENTTNNSKSNPASPKKTAPKLKELSSAPSSPKAQPKLKELSSPTLLSPKPKEEAQQEKKVKKRVSWIEGEGGKRRGEWWKLRPSYFMLVVVLLILVCLVVFGKVFAICCTAVWWYLVPNFSGADESGNARRRSLSKDYVRKLSDKRLSAAAGGGGAQELASPRANGSLGKRG